MRGKTKNNRAQITIFIIIAIIIIASVLIFFLFIQPRYFIQENAGLGFETCMQDAVKEELNILSLQGGYINPQLYYLYQNNKIGYLCYTNLYYKTCTVLRPFIKQHLEEQLTKATKEKVVSCYESSLNELKSRGYNIKQGSINYSVLIEPNKIKILLEAPVTLTRQTAQQFSKFNAEINSNFYNMLMIATSILQYETRYGDSDVTSLMVFYPDLIIDKLKQSDGTTIYIIQDKLTKFKFQFASRSLAWPAGYGADTGLVL